MPHLRSGEALNRRREQYIKRYGHPPIKLKRYDPFFSHLLGTKIIAITKFDKLDLDSKHRKTLKNIHKACGICGWGIYPDALIIHHKDLNGNNHHLSNLAVLCRNCHYLVHNGIVTLPCKGEGNGA